MATKCKVRLTFLISIRLRMILGNDKICGYIVIGLIVGCCNCNTLFAEKDTLRVSPIRLGAIAGITTAGFLYGHVLQNNLWWKGERTNFYFNTERDWEYALGADKLGHAYFSFFVSGFYSDMLRWSGVDTVTSVYTGAGIALAYQTYVEVRDGFSRDNGGGYLGFSPGDMAANTLGAAFPIAQFYVPSLRNYSLKISFDWQNYDRNKYGAIIDDYENTIHWLAINSKAIIPEDWRKTWYPEWIGFAIGHSVNGLNGQGGGNHELYVSLDWDIEALPINGGLWDVLKRSLSRYRLPAPAIRILPEITWYGLKL